ncbi:hypothetical protein DA2_3586 [Desulfovibrio sp. A2]|nr:hypothetical protein DA2_3586 [Desulfovibrio sp. A2]
MCRTGVVNDGGGEGKPTRHAHTEHANDWGRHVQWRVMFP